LSKAGEVVGHGDGCGVFWEQWWELWQETELCFRKRNSVSHFESLSHETELCFPFCESESDLLAENGTLFLGTMAGNGTLFPVMEMILGDSKTLGGGVLDGVLGRTLVGWLASWINGWRACRTAGRLIGCRLNVGYVGCSYWPQQCHHHR
jgi:hypothetical protein